MAGRGEKGGFIAQLRRTLRLFLVTISGDSASRRKEGDRVERETETEEEKGRRRERRRERDVGRGDSVYDDDSNGEADSLECFFFPRYRRTYLPAQ